MSLVALRQAAGIPENIRVVSDEFDLSTITTADLVFALAALVSSVFIAQIVKRILRRVLTDIDGMPELAGDVIARIISYGIMLLGAVVALEALGFSVGPVGSLLLIVTIVLLISAKPLFQDLGAGLILQIRRPFSIGDQVMLLGSEGTIDEVSARTVRMVTVDGERIHLPNRSVLDGSITNLTALNGRMTTFVAGVAYDTDLDHACAIAVGAMSAATLVLEEPQPLALVQEFAESTIGIACRFWHEPEIERSWTARDQAMRAVKAAFDAHGITIAFPQRVVWSAPQQSDRSPQV